MIDVVAAEVGLISRQKALWQANQTMQNTNANWPRDSRGWFTHFTGPEFNVQGEFSTIDSSIMIAGAYMAGNYFPELKSLAESIGNTPQWNSIFPGGEDGPFGMFMVSGGGGMGGETKPFNEYYIVAFLAQMHEDPSSNLAKNFFRDMFGDPNVNNGKPVGRVVSWGQRFPVDRVYQGYRMQSDGDWDMSTFALQFPWIAVTGMHSNPWWRDIVYPEWYEAERHWWNSLTNKDWAGFQTSWGADAFGKVFGCGAGDSPTGYYVEKIRNDANYVFSAANMAGFLGLEEKRATINANLQWMYDNGIHYTKVMADGSTAKVLWRHSLNNPTWRGGWSTSVDYSTMVLGYAFNYLPSGFYSTYAAGLKRAFIAST